MVVFLNEKCLFFKSDMVLFRNLIWNNFDGYVILDYDWFLLVLDLVLFFGI